MSSVKVAVRVRPFNKREIDLKCDNIIHMVENKTIINNPKSVNDEDAKEFTFDHSYWSFDKNGVNFASQSLIFDHLGKDIVSDAIEGYNSCIFAYGQTGSGKTHTMMGDSSSEGLIPRICQWLFQQMASLEKNNNAVSYKTEIQYMEIYLEQVRDLLDTSPDINGNDRRTLKVREHPKHGPYVEKLSRHMVYSYNDILKLMTKGNNNRTTASTSMNDTSSRSHAIFTIMFTKASYIANNPYETISKINLVDLAGSERANSTNAQGQRLVEGSHINKSLVTLANVISNLAENCKRGDGKRKNFIPYRDSVLTWLLKDSLGGNSKTVMVATISPADVNYSETLNTLRYANRAKNILNKPHINEDINTKLIRELRLEIERLNSMIKQNPQLSEQVQENEAKVKELTAEWIGKWDEIMKILQDQKFVAIRKSGDFGLILDSDRPHLIVCVDDDVLSTGVTLYHLNEGQTSIGTKLAEKKQDIIINCGPDVENEHCYIYWDVGENIVTLHPINQALCFVNNSQVDSPTVLHQGNFIVFGENMFRFSNPLEVKCLKQKCSDDTSGQTYTSILNRSTHLISSTSYDSMYNSINSLNKKALMSSFASTYTNDEESEIGKSSNASETEPTRSTDKFYSIEEELEFIKCFLLELQQTIECIRERNDRSMMDSFIQIIIKIGKQEQFSKERILQTLSAIQKLELHQSDNVAVQRVGEYLLTKLNDLKLHLQEQMRADQSNNNESGIGSSTIDSIASDSDQLSDSDRPNAIADTSLPDSTYRHMCRLSAEVDSTLALLSDCMSKLNMSTSIQQTVFDEVRPQNSTNEPVSPTPTDGLTKIEFDEMVENEVQRRLELHLAQNGALERRQNSSPEVSFEGNLNFLPKDVLYSTNSLNLTNSSIFESSRQRSISLCFDEIDQFMIVIPSFHLFHHPDEHFEYEIKIGINGDRWTIYRRYRSFLQLHRFIRMQYGERIKMPYFPPKRWNNRCEKVIETRRRFLENYLQKVVDRCKQLSDCPLYHRENSVEHLNRLCLYSFNSFFHISPPVDKDDS